MQKSRLASVLFSKIILRFSKKIEMNQIKSIAQRDNYVDCIKGALIVLVVFGHIIESLIFKSPYYKAIYSAIYIFHMPLFVLIAGTYSKAELDDRDYRSIITRLIFPLVIFEFAYLALEFAYKGYFPAPIFQPYWILWFLCSMVMWKIMLPLFIRLPAALPLSIVITLLAGKNAEIGYAFSLSRTFYFFPFFLAGYFYGKRLISVIAKNRIFFGFIFSIAFAGSIYWSLSGLEHSVLYGSKGYSIASALDTAPALGRAALLSTSIIASLGFMALIPRRSTLLTYLGQRTMGIYVLHGFIVLFISKILRFLGIEPSYFLLVVLAVISVACSFILAAFDPWLNAMFYRPWLARR